MLLKEATKKLSAAMKANNYLEIVVAQGMLESSENRMEKMRDCRHVSRKGRS